jgi:hypothetical protein
VSCLQEQREVYVKIVLHWLLFELWPSGSPDLNQLEFYSLVRLKSMLYTTTVKDVAELQREVGDTCKLCELLGSHGGEYR